jgi:hypothetical protein
VGRSMAISMTKHTVLILAILTVISLTPAQSPSGSSRLEIFISDTHFGVGKDTAGHWHPYEDARWAPEFAEFLETMNKLGDGHADLIMNGDTFELWQSLDPNDCTVLENRNLGCNEADALKRLRTVLASHQAELRAIGKFARTGQNQVFIVPGNHDAALLFDQVARTVVREIGAPTDHLRIVVDGYWLSPDGLVYAEHGQQIGLDVNKFDNWPKPFITWGGNRYLQRPWGEQFVQRFYNSFEAKYPIIDNISDESLGVRYGLAAEGPSAIPRDLGLFVHFYLTELSWKQTSQNLGDNPAMPDWDIAAIRQQGNEFFVESIPENDPLRTAVQDQLRKGTFGLSMSDLSNEEIGNICDLRKVIADENIDHPAVRQCPQMTLGAITQSLVSSRNKVFTQHLDETFDHLVKAGRIERDRAFQLFVYSHTHLSDPGFEPLKGSGRSWNPFVVNTGAWQRTATPEQLDSIRRKRNLDDKLLLKLEPEDLPPCYPFVMVAPYAATPVSALRFWRKLDGSWSISKSCEE